ncbi:unnamed protein product [Cylicostephanus goldi]|uniref:CUB domain-containing protein n=1 Tax=Cylicostephanus goldi TaxID=71465 RepID=A0A3P6Q7U8_CYLGO|nr:unnamed protein product [Cylicostephanus goldi]
MVNIAVLLLAIVVSSAQALSFYSRHHAIECGSRINAEGSYRLPKHEMCTLTVDVPEKHAVQITVSGKEFKCRHHASDLMIVSSETKTPVFPCFDRAGGAVFVGGDREYMINVRELPAGTHIGVSYYSTHFECGDAVPFDVVGIPLTMSYKSAERSCSLILPGRAQAAVESVEGSGVCIQIKQGLRMGDFPLHSKKVCQKEKGVISRKITFSEVHCPTNTRKASAPAAREPKPVISRRECILLRADIEREDGRQEG